MTVNFYFHFANETWGSSSPQNSGIIQQAAAKIEFFSISFLNIFGRCRIYRRSIL